MEPPQEYVVLGLLMKQERHGYEIHRYFSPGLGRVWYAGMSQVYALLKRLEAAGKVVSTVELQGNRPAKKVYSITPRGHEDFLGWVHEPLKRVRDLRLEFLAKLFFMRELGLAGTDELIQRQIDVCQGQLQALRHKDRTSSDEFDHLVFQFRIYQIEAILTWLQDCEHYFNH